MTQTTDDVSPPTSGMRFGYTRVSTVAQTLDQQNHALEAVGVSKIFSDTMSGARDDRPGLAALMEQLRPDDTVVVWKLDRLGRNMIHILETVKTLTEMGVTLAVLRGGNYRKRYFSVAVAKCQKGDETFPDITPHDLRHTAASLAISAGANVKAVQRMLGHAKASMTLDVYAHARDVKNECAGESWPRCGAFQR